MTCTQQLAGLLWEIDGNFWCKLNYCYVQALALAETMVGCEDCIDCSNCTDCVNCVECDGCHGCNDCYRCTDCTTCTDCTNYNGVINCKYHHTTTQLNLINKITKD